MERDIYTIAEWQEAVSNGWFNEYDGSGIWLDKDLGRLGSDHPSRPHYDDVFATPPEGATHVEWFNK